MALAFVVPGALAQITGGYLYDRQVVEGLRRQGREVTLIELAGSHPDADLAARTAASEALAGLPAGSTVVIDGLALPAFAGSLKAHAERLRVIGFIHHPLSLETGLNPATAHHYAALEAELWPLLKGVICPSEHTARAILASGLPRNRIAVVAPGTQKQAHAAQVERCPGPLQLLAVGTVTPRKGHLLLIEALANLRELDWRLTCIGSLERAPACTDALRTAVAAHHLEDRIELQGEQPAEHLAEAYRKADVFVLPSYHEGYGMVFSEALAHGLPIISTTAGAIPDAAPSVASLLVAPGDALALSAALRRVLSDDDLRARLAAGALEAAASLTDWNSALLNWMTALDELAA